MSRFIPVTEGFAVCTQVSPEEVAGFAAAGFTRLVNNRPDGEEGAQPASADLAAAAIASGLSYVHAPIAQAPTEIAVEAVADALEAGGRTLAFCRSGTRSITLWALAQAQRGAMAPDEILSLAKAAGYELGQWRGALEQLAPKAD